MTNLSAKILCAVLIVLGILNIIIGLNVGLGGILTMGWQGQKPFFEITDQDAFLLQDSHIRFFGGLYLGIGLFLIFATTNLSKYKTALRLVFILIFLGGLARFSMMRPDVMFGHALLTSVLVELLLMPLLYLWLSKTINRRAESMGQRAQS